MKIKWLWLLILSTSINATVIDSIIGIAQANHKEFCRPGTAIRWTIRTDDGKDCKHKMGASVARMACFQYPGFEDSSCAKHANRLRITDYETARQALEQGVSKHVFKLSDIFLFFSSSHFLNC